MSFNPGVTIFIPLYNGVEFLETSLLSVISQTYDNWEVIIGVNGHGIGSETEKKVMEIVNTKNRFIHKIRVVVYNTKGRSETLNSMVLDATYDYIAILNVFDIWLPEKLEQQVQYLKNYDVVGTQCEYFGKIEGYPNVPSGDLSHINFLISNPIINSSVVLKKKDAYWTQDVLDDYDIWLRLNHENKKIYNINKILYRHYIHEENEINPEYINELKTKWKDIYSK
jgi:teichuronic acid biosynthesis glycosyltransferase TuaG